MDKKYYILGLFAGDGWFAIRGIQIGTNSKSFATKIVEIMNSLSLKAITKKRIYRDGHTMFIISVWSKALCEEFKMLLRTDKKKSKTFKPPDFMTKEQSRSFVAGIMDAEASAFIWKNKPRVGLGIYNENAAKFVHGCLRNDAIKCYISICKSGEFKLDFTGNSNVDKFFEIYPVIRLRSPHMGQS